jgi:hypothetical protein
MKLIYRLANPGRKRKLTYNIHSETVSTFCEPPVHHVIDRLSEFWVLPVQVWISAEAQRSRMGLTGLFLEESVAVPLLRSFVKGP